LTEKSGTDSVKVKLPCALTEHHAMKAFWGSGGIYSTIHSCHIQNEILNFSALMNI